MANLDPFPRAHRDEGALARPRDAHYSDEDIARSVSKVTKTLGAEEFSVAHLGVRPLRKPFDFGSGELEGSSKSESEKLASDSDPPESSSDSSISTLGGL
jgi:hypothetical protein